MSEEKKPADPQTVVDETRGFWRELARETIKNSAATIDETAKQLITTQGYWRGYIFTRSPMLTYAAKSQSLGQYLLTSLR